MTKLPDLSQFYGSDTFYKHLGSLVYTEGIKHLADEAGAYWLLDLVASHQGKLREDWFQLWRIEPHGNGCLVTARHDTHEPPVVSQEVEYTDFPLDEPFEWYVCDNGSGVTMMLKSEY